MPCWQKQGGVGVISYNPSLLLLSWSVFQPATPSVEGATEVESGVNSVSWFSCRSMIVTGRATCPHHIDADVITITPEITRQPTIMVYMSEMPEINAMPQRVCAQE